MLSREGTQGGLQEFFISRAAHSDGAKVASERHANPGSRVTRMGEHAGAIMKPGQFALSLLGGTFRS